VGRHISEMGGIAEKMLADAMEALGGMNPPN
jgi:phosphate transport system protein